MNEEKVSEWQDGVPPCDGIWQISVPEHVSYLFNGTYYARFQNGKWSGGYKLFKDCNAQTIFYPYDGNNDPTKLRQWRGVIEE